jgi:uncharacterized protein related to proFAR isomerase
MDEINIIYKIQKRLQATLQQIGDVMISGGVDNMEKIQVFTRSGTSLPINITGNL